MRCRWLWHAWWALGALCACARPESRAVTPVASIEHADLELGHIALVATIDGALHGLDRATGREIWAVGEGKLAQPLVFSSYGKNHHSLDDVINEARNTGDTETLRALRGLGIYVAEPSTGGDLYMLRIRDGDTRPRLEKMPFTLPQLVDLSPFSFSSDDTRIYVAQKHTRLLELNVFTGKIGAVFDSADATSEMFPSGAPPHAVESPWVYVGRTDYTLTVHMRNSPGAAQTVSYSVYVPNTADLEVETLWLNDKQPADGRALLPAPEKSAVACFDVNQWKDRTVPPVVWEHKFSTTPVAVFDIVFAPKHSHSHLLRPVLVPHVPARLGDAFPTSARPSTYLGIAAGGSLFALGASKYPLVEFSALAGTKESAPALPSGPLAGIVGSYDVQLPGASGRLPLIEGARSPNALPPIPADPVVDARLVAQLFGLALFLWVIFRGYTTIQRERSPIVLSTDTLAFDERSTMFRESRPGPSVADASVGLTEPPAVIAAAPSTQTAAASIPEATDAPEDETEDVIDTSATADDETTPRRRRRRRGKRAGAAVLARQVREEEASQNDSTASDTRPDSGPVGLELSSDVLGYGSCGTVVFRGKFQGRAVAVKRLLRDFVEMASKEVSLLESADNQCVPANSPNVIRYFYQELTPNFLFIALEQCPASLADLVERPIEHTDLARKLEPRNALLQIAAGLQHLHSLSSAYMLTSRAQRHQATEYSRRTWGAREAAHAPV